MMTFYIPVPAVGMGYDLAEGSPGYTDRVLHIAAEGDIVPAGRSPAGVAGRSRLGCRSSRRLTCCAEKH